MKTQTWRITLLFKKRLIIFIGIFYKLWTRLSACCSLLCISLHICTKVKHRPKLIHCQQNVIRYKNLNNKQPRILLCNFDLYMRYNTLQIDQLHVFQLLCLAQKFVYCKNYLRRWSFLRQTNCSMYDHCSKNSNMFRWINAGKNSPTSKND